MALSARNHLPGTIDDIQWGDVRVVRSTTLSSTLERSTPRLRACARE
jgi:molybdopterin-binding protein